MFARYGSNLQPTYISIESWAQHLTKPPVTGPDLRDPEYGISTCFE